MKMQQFKRGLGPSPETGAPKQLSQSAKIVNFLFFFANKTNLI